MPKYSHGVTRRNWDKHGETPSLLDFAGIVGDGVHDDAAGINNAIADVVAAGGLTLRIPGGKTFFVKSPILLPAGSLNLTIFGDGDSSIIKRGADMPNGNGVFDVAGSQVTLREFVIEGDVTVATGVNYSTITDPMQTSLTKNTSVWAHGGVSDLLIDSIRFFHTGGYAVLLDATAGDITNVRITSCRFRNNRPHLFGVSALDLSYGTWTGGIHYQGDGVNYRVKTLLVDGCCFQRGTGNQIWGHGYAFTKMHEDVRVTGNTFEDIGRDCVELGNTIGGLVSNNIGRRIGYIATDDTSAAQPKYLGGQYAVFIDTTGTSGVDYIGNTCISALGAFFDLDGFAFGRVSGNTCRVPVASDPEYAEDLIAAWPGNYTYGIQTANNYYAPGGTNVSITDNTFINCGYGAIRLFAARGCHISGNTISHPAGAAFPPIMLGNFVPTSGGGQVDTADCDVAGNNIQWSPAAAAAAIQEMENWGAGLLPWSGETNWVAGNHIFGANATEFSKAASSASIAGTLISNAGTMPSASGFASLKADSSALHLSVDGDAFKPLARVAGSATHVQFNDSTGQNLAGSADLTWDNTGRVLRVGGAAATGIEAYAFNSRANGSDIGFQLTNLKFLVDGDGNVTSSAAMSAKTHVLINGVAPATSTGYAYFYADAAAIHVSVNGAPFSQLATVAGSNTQIQFNDGGALGGSANLTWSSNILSAPFFYSTKGLGDNTDAFSTHSQEAHITGSGAIYGQSLAVTNAVAAGSMTIGGDAVATQAWIGSQGYIHGPGLSYLSNILNAPFFYSTKGIGDHTDAFSTGSQEAHITGNGDIYGQSLAVTNAVAAGSMTIGGNAVATQAWVNGQGFATQTWVGAQGFVGGSGLSYGSNVLTSPMFYSTKGVGNHTDAFSTNSQESHITGNGDIYGQSLAVTNAVAAGSMTIGGNAVATQAWVGSQGFVGGSGLSYGSNILTAPFFYSTKGVGNSSDAFSTHSQEAHITGNGDIYGQSLAVTNAVAAGSMTISGNAVATQSWVNSQGFLGSSFTSGYANVAAAVTAAENWAQGQIFSALTSHLAAYHGSATSHTHQVTVSGTVYTTTATNGTP